MSMPRALWYTHSCAIRERGKAEGQPYLEGEFANGPTVALLLFQRNPHLSKHVQRQIMDEF